MHVPFETFFIFLIFIFFTSSIYFLTVNTGILEPLITLSATLPSRNFSIPLLPSVPITIRSNDCSSANLSISFAGWPSRIHFLTFTPFIAAFSSMDLIALSPSILSIFFNPSMDASIGTDDPVSYSVLISKFSGGDIMLIT